MNILYAAYNATPFSATDKASHAAGVLPGIINTKKISVRVILPKLGNISEKYTKKMKLVETFYVQLKWQQVQYKLYTLKFGGVLHYFIENDYYFGRNEAWGNSDAGECAAFFSKAVLESVNLMRDFKPDIIHANDWQCGLIPVFLKEQYRKEELFKKIKTIYTINDIHKREFFSKLLIEDVCGLGQTPAKALLMNEAGQVDYMQGGCCYADKITVTSPTYAREIHSAEFGGTLSNIFEKRSCDLVGILNGVDYKKWDPESDKFIDVQYNVETLLDRSTNKKYLQMDLGLEMNMELPLLSFVATEDKNSGTELMPELLSKIMGKEAQIVIMGNADSQTESVIADFSMKNPGRVVFSKGYDEALFHKLLASSDLFLFPAKEAASRQSQLLALRYGAIPIARNTGAFADTIDGNTGLLFGDYNCESFFATISFGIDLYSIDRNRWMRMQAWGMTRDFSVKQMSYGYTDLYAGLTQN